VSPSTARRDRTEKRKIYERNRVDEYRLVDPTRKEVTVLILGKSGYRAGRATKSDRIPSRALPDLDLRAG
jgi:Uma2 family endonuclease